MKHEKINCPECNKLITKNNLKNHVGSKACNDFKNGIIKKSFNINDYSKSETGKYICPECNKEYTEKGMPTHLWRTHGSGQSHNPNLGFKYKGDRIAWNKGKTKETDDRVKKNAIGVSKTVQQQIADGTYVVRKMGKEARQKLSERQSLHNTGGKSKWYEVNGIKVQGTYEKQFAESLTEQNIVWIKPRVNNYIFYYYKDGIKGYWWVDDENKMKLVKEFHKDKPLVVIYGKKLLDKISSDIVNEIIKLNHWSW